MIEISREKAEKLYRQMVTIRRFEETVANLMDQGKLVGEAHLYIGQEASGVGICAALNQDDYITSTHRGHGHVIAKGADIKRMMAELFGEKDRLLQGKGRLDPCRGCISGDPGGEWDRRRRHPNRHRCGFGCAG